MSRRNRLDGCGMVTAHSRSTVAEAKTDSMLCPTLTSCRLQANGDPAALKAINIAPDRHYRPSSAMTSAGGLGSCVLAPPPGIQPAMARIVPLPRGSLVVFMTRRLRYWESTGCTPCRCWFWTAFKSQLCDMVWNTSIHPLTKVPPKPSHLQPV